MMAFIIISCLFSYLFLFLCDFVSLLCQLSCQRENAHCFTAVVYWRTDMQWGLDCLAVFAVCSSAAYSRDIALIQPRPPNARFN